MLFDNSDHLHNISPSQNTFYRAVIEDNDDSKEPGGTLGRCRVRVLGIHPQNAKRTGKNKGVPTDELPWAELMVSTAFHGGMSGFGISAVPLKGTWVWVFFDGGDWNRPIITGLIYSISTKQGPGASKPNGGFYDPDKVYPIKKKLNEQDINRLAANRKFAETPIKKIRDANKDKGISTSTGGTWDEILEASSKAKYPQNTVFETKGQSIIEYDSTDGNERIHFFHKTGTYWEMQENGDYQSKTTGKHYEIMNKDYHRLVKKNQRVTVQADVETKYDAKETILVGGARKETVKGIVNEEYKSGQNTKGGPKITIKAGVILLN
jgi:hypothetical protein